MCIAVMQKSDLGAGGCKRNKLSCCVATMAQYYSSIMRGGEESGGGEPGGGEGEGGFGRVWGMKKGLRSLCHVADAQLCFAAGRGGQNHVDVPSANAWLQRLSVF